MTEIILIFPPQWIPVHPYLALPCLTAYLEDRGINVKQFDLNTLCYDVFLTKKNLESILNQIDQKISDFERNSSSSKISAFEYKELQMSYVVGGSIINDVEKSKSIIRNLSEFLNPEKYESSMLTIREALTTISSAFYPTELNLDIFKMKYSFFSMEQIFQAIRDKQTNPFIEIFIELFVPMLLKEESTIIGISITGATQIIPSFTLAKLLKEVNKNVIIVIGGNVFSRLPRTTLMRLLASFKFIDAIVVFEGEETLYQFIEQYPRRRYEEIPNLIFKDEKGIVKANLNLPVIHHLDSLPFPNFDGLPLNKYLSPNLILPLLSSRGCYWGKCAFCTHDYGYGFNYRVKSIERFVDEIEHESRKYNTKFFEFVDECIAPSRLIRIAKAIVKRGLKVYWNVELRLDKYFLQDLNILYNAGCRAIYWGLESASQRVLNKMEKGINIELVPKILQNTSRIGIWNHVFFFFGFPTESDVEAKSTSDFIFSHQDIIHSVGASYFNLEINSPVYRKPKSYGLQIIEKIDEPFAIWFNYKTETGISSNEAKIKYLQFVKEFQRELPAIYLRNHDLICLAIRGRNWLRNISKKIRDELKEAGLKTIPKIYSIYCKPYVKFQNLTYKTYKFDTIKKNEDDLIKIIPEEIVLIYDRKLRRIWKTNTIGLSILKLCNGQNTIIDILNKLSKKYSLIEDSKIKIAIFLQELIQELAQKQLITISL